MKKNVLFGLMLVVAGCAAKKVAVNNPDQVDIKYGQSKFEGYSQTMFEAGRTIANKSCTSCHNLKDPKMLTEERIYKVIPNMAEKAKLSNEDKDLVLKYYIASGKHI